MFKVNNKSIP